MTEEEWLVGTHPLDMLDHAACQVSVRKLRLVAAACCRALGRADAAAACESVADGLADVASLKYVPGAAPPQLGGRNTWSSNPARIRPEGQASSVTWAATRPDPLDAARTAALHAFPQLQRRLIDLLHEVLGNLFNWPKIEPAWLFSNNAIVRHLAHSIYNERAFDDLPILADALEDADCTEVTMLEHLRGPGPHLRGCWVIDALTGRS